MHILKKNEHDIPCPQNNQNITQFQKINAQQQIYWDLVSTKTKKNDQS